MKKWQLGFVLFLLFSLIPIAELHAYGPLGEMSLMGSFSKTDYGQGSFAMTRRYSGSFSYNLTRVTEVELSYTVTASEFNYPGIQSTKVNEQALGLSIVQSLVPRTWLIQPYVKGGAAQYNRQQSGTVAGIATAPSNSKSPSGLMGAGVRIFLLRNFSLKVEGVTFLPDLNFAEAKNNFSVQGGAGWYF